MNIFAVGGVEGNALCVCVSASIGVQSRERDSDLAKPAGLARLEKKSDTTESRYQARPDCNSFTHNERATPAWFGLRKQVETVAESVCADKANAGRSGATVGRDRHQFNSPVVRNGI